MDAAWIRFSLILWKSARMVLAELASQTKHKAVHRMIPMLCTPKWGKGAKVAPCRSLMILTQPTLQEGWAVWAVQM